MPNPNGNHNPDNRCTDYQDIAGSSSADEIANVNFGYTQE